MNIRNLNESTTVDFLRGLIASERNVPFIGSGFTFGEKAKKKMVPDGNGWMETMRKQISASGTENKPSNDELVKYTFQELSDIYFREDIVDIELIKRTLDESFSKVKITNEAKKAFLHLGWPYIYTLNIDDAIEEEIGAVKVVPYESFSRSTDRTFIYKMHGDVWGALSAASRDGLKLIFAKADYIASLKKNLPLIMQLTADLEESNVLFIGCSFIDELDILYSLSGVNTSKPTEARRRVYITSSEPTDYTTKKRLMNYGITDVIVCDYNEFYFLYKEIYIELKGDRAEKSEFDFNPRALPDFTNKNFLSYFVQADWGGGNPGPLAVTRAVEEKIMGAIEVNPIVYLKGGRFSGKTSLLYHVLNSAPTRRLFFVDSSSSLTNSALESLLLHKNSLIVFDSETLDYHQVKRLFSKSESIQERNSRVLIAVGKAEINYIETLNITSCQFDLDNHFIGEEVNSVNRIFDSIGFPRISNRKKILDIIYDLSDSHITSSVLKSTSSLHKKITDRINFASRSGFSLVEFSLIYMLAIQQKIPSMHYRQIISRSGFNNSVEEYIEEFDKIWSPFIENKKTTSSTFQVTHSKFILVSNSQIWLYYILRKLCEQQGAESISEKIVDLVSLLRDAGIQHSELILFDSLNSAFSQSRLVINFTYEKLSRVLADDPNYWLQRAKSVYQNHLKNSTEDVLVAIEFANKAIKDSEKKVTVNAKLTRANLYGLLCAKSNYSDAGFLVVAIKMYKEAAEDYHDNQLYLNELFERSRKGQGYLRKLLDKLGSMQASPEILTVKYELAELRTYV